MQRDNFWERSCPDMPDDTAVSCAKMAEPIEMLFGLWTRVGPRKYVVDGVQILRAKQQFLGERTCRGVPDDTFW